MQFRVRLFLPVLGRPDERVHAAVVSESQVLDFCAASSPTHPSSSRPTLPQMAMPRAGRYDEARAPSMNLVPQPDFSLRIRLLPNPHVISVTGRKFAEILPS